MTLPNVIRLISDLWESDPCLLTLECSDIKADSQEQWQKTQLTMAPEGEKKNWEF